MEITLEQIPRGPLPEWILQHAIQQTIDPRPISEGGPSRILFIHSSALSRDKFLNKISSSTGIVDRSSHLTLNGLCTKIYADLREPRMLPDGPSLELAIHSIMQRKASQLEFPFISIPFVDYLYIIDHVQNQSHSCHHIGLRLLL